MVKEIGETAHELAFRQADQGHHQDAERAAVTGISVDPLNEALWRVRLMAAQRSGHTERALEATGRLEELADEHEIELEPDTIHLINTIRSKPRRPTPDLPR